jgi:hypothetical protein
MFTFDIMFVSVNTMECMEPLALKVTSPGNAWEYYIAHHIQQQISPVMVNL